MPLLGLLTLAGAIAALVLMITGKLIPAALAHLMLGLGVLPLILDAIAHFIPVLTRTAPRIGDRRAAAIGLVAGALAVIGQQFWFPLVYIAATLGIAAVGDLLINIQQRVRRCLGTPHPCLQWYQAALWSLAIALIALLLSLLIPEQWPALRRLHLHLNLLGFVGLTAFSTLQVLLPTLSRHPDPTTPERLRRLFPWAVTATAATAVGSAWFIPLAGVGLAIWFIVTARLLAHLMRHFRTYWAASNSAIGLVIAVWGWAFNLVYALLHMLSAQGSDRALWVFVCSFLLPLLSAALSHLVPVTLSPGAETDERQRCQHRFARNTLSRSLLYLIAGGLIAGGYWWAPLLAAATASWFVIQGVAAVVRWNTM